MKYLTVRFTPLGLPKFMEICWEISGKVVLVAKSEGIEINFAGMVRRIFSIQRMTFLAV